MNLCKACLHPKRRDIDRQLVQGVPGAEVARRFGVPARSLYNHMKKHLHHQLVSAVMKQKDRHETDLADDLFGLLQRAKAILDVAEADGRLPLALKAIGESRSTIMTLAQIAEMIEKKRSTDRHTAHRVQVEELKSKLNREELETLQAILSKLEGTPEPLPPPIASLQVPDEETDVLGEVEIPLKTDVATEIDEPEEDGAAWWDPEGLTWEERMKQRPLREVGDAHVVRVQRIREQTRRRREARTETLLADALAGSVRIKTLLR